MSSFFTGSSKVKIPKVDLKAEGPWIDVWEALPPFREDGTLELTYSASCRRPLVFIETTDSNEETMKDEKSKMELLKWHDTGQEKVKVFAGKELFWSNTLRQCALMEGVEKHLPKIFYLL